MRFGKRIKEEQDDHFEGSYVDYQGLKKHIKAEEERDARHGPGAHAADARETSISVAASRANRGDNAPTFFDLFDKEVPHLLAPSKAPNLWRSVVARLTVHHACAQQSA